MKTQLTFVVLLLNPWALWATIVELDISPPGSGPATGLSPGNEVIATASNGSGGEIGRGIYLDTDTRALYFNLGYGSSFGFRDLTEPAFAWLLHGPAALGETAPAIFNLGPFHTFAADPAKGGIISGSLQLDLASEANLLKGLDYINIYTTANLGGELRGQLLVVPEPSFAAMVATIVAGLLGYSRAPRSPSKSL